MEDCIFCAIVEKRVPAWTVLESEHCLAFLDTNPVAEYHTLVIPKQHFENIFHAPKEVLSDAMALTKEVCQLYEDKIGIDSVQLFNNSGPNSAQSVFHLHLHILPRVKDDAIRFDVRFMKHLVPEFPKMLERLK